MSDLEIQVPQTAAGRWEKAENLVMAASALKPEDVKALLNEVIQKASKDGILTYQTAYALLHDKWHDAYYKDHDQAAASTVAEVMSIVYLQNQMNNHLREGTYKIPSMNSLHNDAMGAASFAAAQQSQLNLKQQNADKLATEKAELATHTPLNLAITEAIKKSYFGKTEDIPKIEARMTAFLQDPRRASMTYDEQLYALENDSGNTWKDLWANRDDIISIYKRACEIKQQRDDELAKKEAQPQPQPNPPENKTSAPEAGKTVKTKTEAETKDQATAPETNPETNTANTAAKTKKAPRTVTHDDGVGAVGDGALAKSAVDEAFKLEAKTHFFNDPDKDATTALQRGLERVGFRLDSAGIDGKYGNETKGQVAAFQKAAGLPVTGIADAATLRILQVEEVKALAAQYKNGTLTPAQKTAMITEYNDVAAVESKLPDKAKADLKTALAGLKGQFTEADGAIFVAVGNVPAKNSVVTR